MAFAYDVYSYYVEGGDDVVIDKELSLLCRLW